MFNSSFVAAKLRSRAAFCLFLFACLPAWATWTCQQGGTGCTVTTTRDCSVGGTSCSITVTSTHAHAVEAICEQSGSTSSLISSTSDGGFTAASGSHGTDSSAGGVECAYNLNATGSATSITCTFSVSASNQCFFFEFTGTGSTFTFDTSNKVDSTSCTSCTGVALTLGTSNNYILVQTAGCSATCSAINQSYTGVFFNGDGQAFKLNVSSAGTTPSWTSTSGNIAGGAIAIYEVTGGGSTCAQSIALMGVGCR